MDETLVKSLIETDTQLAAIQKQVSEATAAFQGQLSALQERDREIRSALEKAMLDSGTKKFENELISITYVAPTTRTTLDTAKVKEKYPEAYSNCTKTSAVSGLVRIKVK